MVINIMDYKYLKDLADIIYIPNMNKFQVWTYLESLAKNNILVCDIHVAWITKGVEGLKELGGYYG